MVQGDKQGVVIRVEAQQGQAHQRPAFQIEESYAFLARQLIHGGDS